MTGLSTPAASVESGAPPTDAFEVHRQMVIAVFAATVCLAAGLGAGLYLSHLSALMVVAAAGALGGFVSALRRLYAFQRVFPTNFFRNWHKIDLYLVIYSMIPSLVGSIAAVTLYLIFASGLIRGDLFPKFYQSIAETQLDNFHKFVSNWQPAQSVDYAKALVWSFVAGFSERLVPDMLERLSSSQQEGVSMDVHRCDNSGLVDKEKIT